MGSWSASGVKVIDNREMSIVKTFLQDRFHKARINSPNYYLDVKLNMRYVVYCAFRTGRFSLGR